MTQVNLPDHLSYSSLSCYLQCPLKWKLHYVDRLEPEFITSSLVFGQAIHQSVAAFLESTVTGDLLNADQMTDIARNAWVSGNGNIRYQAKEDENSLMKKTRELLSLYREAWNEEVVVLGVEEGFRFQAEGLPDFVGFIDVIQQMPTGEIVVADLKTASRKPSDFQVRNNDQITAYSLGVESLGFESNTTSYRLDYLMKTAKPELIQYGTGRTGEDKRRFLKMATQVWRAVQQEVWFPKSDWFCTTCFYQSACSAW